MSQKGSMSVRKRYCTLDEIRGITLLSMIVYHGMWDYIYLFGHNCSWYNGAVGYIWQQSICWTFIFLSGFCWQLGKRQLKRGLMILGAGVIITAVTIIAMPESKVVYGVLNLIGISVIIMIVLDKLCKRIDSKIGFIVSIILFIMFRNINYGYLGFENFNIVKFPDWLYANYFSTLIGFTHKEFWSTDYFSIIPWFFLFVAGYFGYKIVNQEGKMDLFKNSYLPLIGVIGRNSLLIYMLHQPIIYVILWCVNLL